MKSLMRKRFGFYLLAILLVLSNVISFVPNVKASTTGVLVSDVGSVGNTITQGNTSRKLAVAANGIIFATYHGTNGIRVARSLDNGKTFQPSVQIIPQNYEAEIAVSATGIVYVGWVENGSARLVKSADDGKTFSAPKDIGSLDGGATLHMATDGDYLYIIGKGRTLLHSNDGGDTFNKSTISAMNYSFADVHVDPKNKNVIVVVDNPSVYYFISNDHGQTFSPIVNTNSSVMYSVGTLVADSNNDTLLYVSGSQTNTLKANITKGTSQTIQFPNNSSSSGRSISGDMFGNIITGFASGSKVFYAVSTNAGNTFGQSKEVAETNIANIAINSTNGDVLFLYQQNGAIYLSTFSGELIGYDLGLSTSGLSFNILGQKKTVTVRNNSINPIQITDIITSGEFTSTSNYSGVLNPGDSFDIEVTFNPTSTDVKNGTIEITTDVSSNKRSIQLTGVITPQLSDESRLKNLSIDKGTLSPAFNPEIKAYSAIVSNEVDSVNIVAELMDSDATMKINAADVTNNTIHQVPLNLGDNQIAIVVTAPNGSLKTYTITITREEPLPIYRIVYNGNGHVDGDVPIDQQNYSTGDTATIKGNEGNLSKTGYVFDGWNTKADGSGQAYSENSTFVIGNESATLFAMWKSVIKPTYTINYDGNGHTNGNVPNDHQVYTTGDTVTIKGNEGNLSKTGYIFDGWNTKANGSGQTYVANSILTIENESVTLFANWKVDNNFTPITYYPPVASLPSIITERINVDLVDDANIDKLLLQIPIERQFDQNGKVKDQVIFTKEKAQEFIEKLQHNGIKTARLIIPDTKDQVQETNIYILKDAINNLSQEKINLSINTINGNIFIPSTSLDTFTDDLYFKIVPLKKDTEKQVIKARMKQEIKVMTKVENANIDIIGRPMTIETNMNSIPVTLTLPIHTNLSQEEIDNLLVFIEHSNGTKEVVKGRIVKTENGVKGIEFDVDHFSTFTILYVEGSNEYFNPVNETVDVEKTLLKHVPYIQGYKDGTFRPNAYITREQMAAMIARQFTNNSTPISSTYTYKDTNKSWAKDDIEYIRSIGIMSGVTRNTFVPNANLTRAQMAVIAIRWIDRDCKEGLKDTKYCDTENEVKTFNDVSSEFWAINEIARISDLGIMVGYSDGTFRPNEKLTRAQAVKILNRLFNRGPINESIEDKFTDVSSQYWAYYEIQEAAVEHSYDFIDSMEKLIK